MKSATNKNGSDDGTGSGSNVIEVSFGADGSVNFEGDEIPNEIAHPESKWFDEALDDDPLNDLLTEFDDEELDDLDCDFNSVTEGQEDYIFHHQETWDFNVKGSDTPYRMSEVLLKQSERLKEDLKRLKYYLDEMNIDG